MYVKPPRRQFGSSFVPDNYNGTAFTEPDPAVQEQEDALTDQAMPEPAPDAIPTAKTEEKGLLPSLFSGFGGLRSDDLLLLALILLMSRNGGGQDNTSEILPLLALLLFLG
ncbi:MAG: hypothetical protein IJW70_05190 [Clostridia bacterium]|nr:hypothetical protein [Clostridia bacterium]